VVDVETAGVLSVVEEVAVAEGTSVGASVEVRVGTEVGVAVCGTYTWTVGPTGNVVTAVVSYPTKK
jgi:hypothetical protein